MNLGKILRTNPDATILITGASSGIGEAAAILLAKEGYRVVLSARRFERLQEIASRIKNKGGIALPVRTDLLRRQDIKDLVSSALDKFGSIDVLFNNAGVGRMGWLEELDPIEDIEQQLMINLLGTIQMTQAVLPHMIEQGRGQIINMASMAGLVATPTYTIYAASKFGVRGFSEALRREVAMHGINVSVLYPGGVENEFSRKARIKRKTRVTTPSRLRLNDEDVAQAVLSLVRRPRRSLVIPWQLRMAVWGNMWFGGFFDWVMERYFVRLERE